MHKVIKSEPISTEIIDIIKKRYRTIVKTINREFWNIDSESLHGLFAGSYGRGTAISTSDVDILVELPRSEKGRFDDCNYNGQSYLLQTVKKEIEETYPRSEIHADGQVVIINFTDGIVFEVVPVFRKSSFQFNDDGYIYPDTNRGGRWRDTNPIPEQYAMENLNSYNFSNGLLVDTCKHIRNIKYTYFSSYTLSGILIDSFIFKAIGDWHWIREGETKTSSVISYEEHILNYYNKWTVDKTCIITLLAPGSGAEVNTDDWEVLGKVLRKMVE